MALVAPNSHVVTLAAEHAAMAVWVQPYLTPAPVTVRIPDGLPEDFVCQIVNDTDFPVTVVAYGAAVTLLSPAGTLPMIEARYGLVTLWPAPTPGTWIIAGDLVLT
ncbi:MAG: hypothetical protein MUE49_13160 [Rhodospirillales bacterium]|nr:hypothetical protein [Rhodospirillales bacterium]